ncbi:MAG: hypothetical protein BGO99_08765 [Nitrosospira sp. 56-18]|jgi:hypothetical protein|nr:hypothetical protein [Nitrosospira sp.]OJY12695.1 MAG: hypothetical protein BGO99_08765 [Nitrosospira sp. 56-18]
MTKTTVMICRDPKGLNRQLVPLLPATGAITLIGWKQIPEPVDGGVPNDVAMMLARAFTSVARVTFFGISEADVTSRDWLLLKEDFVRAVNKRGLIGRAQQLIDRIPYNAVLVSTRQAKTVIRLFDEPAFPWWLEGQIVLLSSTEGPPPLLDIKSVISLLDNDDSSRQRETCLDAGILGIIRPGVDGDIAGFLSLDPSIEAQLLSTLEDESTCSGFDWSVLCEAEFGERFAGA